MLTERITTVPEDFEAGLASWREENWEDVFHADAMENAQTITTKIDPAVAAALGLELTDAEADATYQVVDLRPKLPGSPVANQGPQKKTGGTVVHYNGPATGVPSGRLDPVTLYHNDARYHLTVDWGGGARTNGIQYHYGCWGKVIYILRNTDSILYHCGAWPQNGSCTAINVPIGSGENASRDTLLTLAAFITEENRRQGKSYAATYSHKELSATACPGSLHDQFVVPFRTGRLKATPPPIEPRKWNLLYHGSAYWAKDRATWLADQLGGTAQAVGDAQKVEYLADFCLDYPEAKQYVAVLVGRMVLEYVGAAPEEAMREYGKGVCDVWDGLTAVGMEKCVAAIGRRTGKADLLKRYREKFGAVLVDKPDAPGGDDPGKVLAG